MTDGAILLEFKEEFASLISTLQELNSRLVVLSAAKGVNESIRVTPITAPTTAVTISSGTVTTVSALTNFGVVPTKEVADDINCLTVATCNINNTTGA